MYSASFDLIIPISSQLRPHGKHDEDLAFFNFVGTNHYENVIVFVQNKQPAIKQENKLNFMSTRRLR